MTTRPKQLSSFDATMLVMGGIIGVGIFFAPQSVAAGVPNVGVFLGMWCLGAVVALCGAMTFAEWGGSFPRSGGWFVFLREAFGPFAAFLFAWVILGVVSTGALAVIASIGATYFAKAFALDWSPSSYAHFGAAAALLVGLTGIVLCGIKIGATVQNLCMVTKLIGIGAIVVGGIAFFFNPGDATPIVTTPFENPGYGQLPQAALAVFFAYGGWQHLCYVAPQVRDATRTLPRAIVIGVLGVGLVYLATNLAYLQVLGFEGLATSTQDFAWKVAGRIDARLGRALSAVMAVSAFGVCTVNIIVSPSIYVAMARENLFFKSFGRLHPKTEAPVLALLTQAVLSLGYLWWSRVSAASHSSGESTEFRMNVGTLIDSVVFAEWIFHFLVAWGLLRMRATRPDLPRPFRSPLWPMAPAIYLATAIFILGGNLITTFGYATLLGLGVVSVGAILYVPWRRAFAGD